MNMLFTAVWSDTQPSNAKCLKASFWTIENGCQLDNIDTWFLCVLHYDCMIFIMKCVKACPVTSNMTAFLVTYNDLKFGIGCCAQMLKATILLSNILHSVVAYHCTETAA